MLKNAGFRPPHPGICWRAVRLRVVLFLVLGLLLAVGACACGGGEEVAPLPETVDTTDTVIETEALEGETETSDTDDDGTGQGTTTRGGGGGGDDNGGQGQGGGGDDNGDNGKGNAAAGKPVFSQNCAGCHTLQAAGASGTVGPNLDESDMSFDEAVEQIKEGGSGMPAFEDQLSEKQINDVAALVVESRG